jgi:fused signal recognition particle receptor
MKKRLGEKIRQLFTGKTLDEQFYEDLEDLLIEADIGPAVTMAVVDTLRQRAGKERIDDNKGLLLLLKKVLEDYIRTEELRPTEKGTNIFLVLGVNGVGKTTTIAKLAALFGKQLGKDKILLSSGNRSVEAPCGSSQGGCYFTATRSGPRSSHFRYNRERPFSGIAFDPRRYGRENA